MSMASQTYEGSYAGTANVPTKQSELETIRQSIIETFELCSSINSLHHDLLGPVAVAPRDAKLTPQIEVEGSLRHLERQAQELMESLRNAQSTLNNIRAATSL